MKVYVENVITNDEWTAAEEPKMKLAVIFAEEDSGGYHTGCKVTVFVEKDVNLTLDGLKALALRQAYDTLRRALKAAEPGVS